MSDVVVSDDFKDVTFRRRQNRRARFGRSFEPKRVRFAAVGRIVRVVTRDAGADVGAAPLDGNRSRLFVVLNIGDFGGRRVGVDRVDPNVRNDRLVDVENDRRARFDSRVGSQAVVKFNGKRNVPLARSFFLVVRR